MSYKSPKKKEKEEDEVKKQQGNDLQEKKKTLEDNGENLSKKPLENLKLGQKKQANSSPTAAQDLMD